MQIERSSFPDPWKETEFLDCLKQRHVTGRTLSRRGSVLGFVVYGIHRQRIQILNLAVDPVYRRQGVATKLINALKECLVPPHTCRRIRTEVRETNLGAQLFFKKQEFKAVKILRNFYDGTDEDAYVMKYPTKSE